MQVMDETDRLPAHHTFRDPAGSLSITEDGVFRQVHSSYQNDILNLLRQPFAASLVASGSLIGSEILPSETGSLRLRHPRVSFRSYPWEWSPSMWLAAAELTLNLCSQLVKEGWILKDATPLNVLFQGTEPVFVDLLSIQPMDLNQPIWYAYGQFVRTFLLPMLAHSQLGWPLQTTLTRRDGYEPEDIYTALPWAARLRQPALSSVTLPMLLSGKSRQPNAAPSDNHKPNTLAARSTSDPDVVRQVLLKTLKNLGTQMRRATPAQHTSTWSDYAQTAHHYSGDDHAGKQDFVRAALAHATPARVLDVGCNTGNYSLLAAETGAEVVSIDTDLQAVDRLVSRLHGSHTNILPLCISLAHPTPATGWQNREYPSFLDRACGHFDTVLMLAVIHHLLLGDQIPLEEVALLCSRLTTQHLIIEWVPPTDPRFQEILRGRGHLYTHLTEANFRAAFAPHFHITTETTLSNHRILFHMQRAVA
jgi:SAM-dependent methyltransferase